jgi:hypothetical protein
VKLKTAVSQVLYKDKKRYTMKEYGGVGSSSIVALTLILAVDGYECSNF